MGPNQIYKLLHSKGTTNKTKRHGTGEKICKWCNQWDQFPKYKNRLYSLISKQKKIQSKMDRRPKNTFLQWRHRDGQWAQEKMLCITNY